MHRGSLYVAGGDDAGHGGAVTVGVGRAVGGIFLKVADTWNHDVFEMRIVHIHTRIDDCDGYAFAGGLLMQGVRIEQIIGPRALRDVVLDTRLALLLPVRDGGVDRHAFRFGGNGRSRACRRGGELHALGEHVDPCARNGANVIAGIAEPLEYFLGGLGDGVSRTRGVDGEYGSFVRGSYRRPDQCSRSVSHGYGIGMTAVCGSSIIAGDGQLRMRWGRLTRGMQRIYGARR